MSRYYLGRRYGNTGLTTSGSGGSVRAPVVAFGDYCGGVGLARRYGVSRSNTSGSGGSSAAPLVVAPRGRCNPDGSLINGETYLARRFGTSNGAPTVVPICNICGQPTSGSGGSGSSSGSGLVCQGCCGWCTGTASSADSSICVAPPETLNATVVIGCIGSFTISLARQHFADCSNAGGAYSLYWTGEVITGAVEEGGCSGCPVTIPPTFLNWTGPVPRCGITVACIITSSFGNPPRLTWIVVGLALSATGFVRFGNTGISITPLAPIEFQQNVITSGNGLSCPFHFYYSDVVACDGGPDATLGTGYARTPCQGCVGSAIVVEVTL